MPSEASADASEVMPVRVWLLLMLCVLCLKLTLLYLPLTGLPP